MLILILRVTCFNKIFQLTIIRKNKIMINQIIIYTNVNKFKFFYFSFLEKLFFVKKKNRFKIKI